MANFEIQESEKGLNLIIDASRCLSIFNHEAHTILIHLSEADFMNLFAAVLKYMVKLGEQEDFPKVEVLRESYKAMVKAEAEIRSMEVERQDE